MTKKKNSSYSDLYAALIKSGISQKKARRLVVEYAEQDLYHYGKKKWFKESGQLDAAKATVGVRR